jgi:glycosyltransferase involved in cell wall biosynthesis
MAIESKIVNRIAASAHPDKYSCAKAAIRLSVITINKNNAKRLDKTIKSVLEQTYPHVEQIIIDGGSNDDSVGVIKSFTDIPCKSYASEFKAKNYPFISYWVSEPDRGIYHAMNKGVSQATGNYCLFLNSGDYLIDQNVVSTLLNYKPDADIVYTNQKRFGYKGDRINVFPEKLSFYWLFKGYLPHNCTLFERTLFSRIGFYCEDYNIVSDWLFYLKALAKENCTYQHFKMVLSAMEDGGISNSPEFRLNVKKEREDVLKKEFSFFYEDYSDLYNFRYNSIKNKIKRSIRLLKNAIKMKKF